ncbi:hypothetical protein U1Q18_048958 [Sarracenia purpurea var. burkii]
MGYFSHSEVDMHAFVIPNVDSRLIVEYDREVYWARYAKLDPNCTTSTMKPPSHDEFINDPNVMIAADSGISLIDAEPSDPEAMPVPDAPPAEEELTTFVEEEPATVLPEPEQPSTYDLRSRY